MTTCDWCETLLPLSALFNVDYLNEDGSEKTLDEEPGIMELMDLYYDTDYNIQIKPNIELLEEEEKNRKQEQIKQMKYMNIL